MTYRIASDIGGTFTDLYVQDASDRTHSYKAPTTSADLTEGLFDALGKVAADFDATVSAVLADTEYFIHGTTVATNAVIEETTAPTALVTTEGFRDLLWLREQGKDDPYEWQVDYPDPYVPRARTYTVPERVTAEGDVETPLSEAAASEVIEEIAAGDAEAVAVCLLWSHANPAHERRLGELIETVAPQLEYSLSHEVNPVIREHRRASSTAIDASLAGIVSAYLERLADRLRAAGYEGAPLIVTANGGVMVPSEVARAPIWTVDAGPTMLPTAAAEIATAEMATENVIALDMGGTSLDIGVVDDGTVPRTREATVGRDHVLGIEKVDVTTIGAGGGSIARVDAGGLLHVGPESAGSEPGPACYLRGGTEPTVTDAALALGYVNEAYFLGGEMAVSRAAAEEAIESVVADELSVDVTEAAYAIHSTAVQNAVNGIRESTIEQGIDPREYVLFGGGGALGLVVAEIARELRIEDVLLPGEAGVVSSVGGLASDVRRDFSASNFTEGARFDHRGVNETLASLESEAEAFLERVGIPESNRELHYYVEARYPQQVYELQVQLPTERVEDGEATALIEAFHGVHEATYGFRTEEDVEFLYWRVEAIGRTDVGVAGADAGEVADSNPAAHDHRDGYFDGWESTPAYRAKALEPGHELDGPAFVDAETTTVVLPPFAHLQVTDVGNYRIRIR